MTGRWASLKVNEDFYILGSRITTHILFWIGYYVFFSLLWMTDEGYLASFYLEFVLLPTRMLAVYVTIYFLLPRYLLNRKYGKFILGYMLLLLLAGVLQRVFIHLFYENLLLNDVSRGLFSIRMLLRAVVLINTTVFLVLGIKLFQLWVVANEGRSNPEAILELKSNRRVYMVSPGDILYIEGLGNYVNYHLGDGSRITVYGSVKKAMDGLPHNFVRVHKSYIVNREHIKSFDASSIAVKNQEIPRGKGVKDEQLVS